MAAEKISVRGVLFDNVDMEEAVAVCLSLLEQDGNHTVHTPNAEIVQLCVEQNEYYDLINSADLIIPDGSGVVLAAKILRTPFRHGKVAGVELGERLCKEAAERNIPLFLLGGKPGVAEIAAEKMRGKYPGLPVAGTNDGYFKDDAAVIEKINASGAKILLVCTGVPRQEKWMAAHKDELNVKLMLGLGGSLDIYSGTAKRAPKIFIRLGLEWLYRLIKEPWRLGRMMKLPKFILGTIFHGRRDTARAD